MNSKHTRDPESRIGSARRNKQAALALQCGAESGTDPGGPRCCGTGNRGGGREQEQGVFESEPPGEKSPGGF